MKEKKCQFNCEYANLGGFGFGEAETRGRGRGRGCRSCCPVTGTIAGSQNMTRKRGGGAVRGWRMIHCLRNMYTHVDPQFSPPTFHFFFPKMDSISDPQTMATEAEAVAETESENAMAADEEWTMVMLILHLLSIFSLPDGFSWSNGYSNRGGKFRENGWRKYTF